MRKFLVIIMCVAILTGCSAVSTPKVAVRETLEFEPQSQTSLRIIVVSDVHYLAESLYADNDLFAQVNAKGDGKYLPEIQGILEAFIATCIKEKPNVVIISGDLTLNGEAVSHRDLSEALEALRMAEINVLVVPGNHDINSLFARSYADEKPESVSTIDADDFSQTYQAYGYYAQSQDDGSLSYALDLNDKTRILMVDTNMYQETEENRQSSVNGYLKEGTLAWIEKELEAAKTKGQTVISVTHHNLLHHTDLFPSGFTIDNSGKLLKLYEEYGVLFNLSGHMHIQSVRQRNYGEGMSYDLATGALSVYPHRYGLIEIDQMTARYEAKSLEFKDGTLAVRSQNFFESVAMQMIASQIVDLEVTDDVKGALAESFAAANQCYFAGDDCVDVYSEALDMWSPYEDSFIFEYLLSMSERRSNQLYLEIPLDS